MKLKQLRAFRGYRQQDVAHRLGITQAYYSLIETGKSPIQDKHLTGLSELLGFPEDYLKTVLQEQKEGLDYDQDRQDQAGTQTV